MTKSGKRQGAAESVTLTEQHVLTHLWVWKRRVPPHAFLTLQPHAWRALFADCIQKLKLTQWGIRPHSLRPGGATHLFVKCGSLDNVVLAGRWTAVKTARIYINSGLAMLSEIKIPKPLLSPFHKIFSTWKLKPSPAKRAGLGDVEKRSAQNLGTKGGREALFFFEGRFMLLVVCAWDISLVRRDFQKARESDLLSIVAEKDSLESLKGVGLPSLTTKQFSTFSNCFNLTKLVCNACENNVF